MHVAFKVPLLLPEQLAVQKFEYVAYIGCCPALLDLVQLVHDVSVNERHADDAKEHVLVVVAVSKRILDGELVQA